jgi:hypothetical protein
MLATNMVYVIPSQAAAKIRRENVFTTNNLAGFVLVPEDPSDTTGWQRLVPIDIIEP